MDALIFVFFGLLLLALGIYQAYARKGDRRARVASAAMFARQASVESFNKSTVASILDPYFSLDWGLSRRGKLTCGDVQIKEVLYVLCRKEPWGAVYLIDLIVLEGVGEDQTKKSRLQCVLRFDDFKLPDFELAPKRPYDRLGWLSTRLWGQRPVLLEPHAGLSEHWQLFGLDEERLRGFFAGGVAQLFESIKTPGFTATGGKIFFERGGQRALSFDDLSRFMDDGARLGVAVNGAAERRP